MIAEVRRLLDEKKYLELRDLLCEKEPADIAILFEQFPKEEIPLMFRILHKDFATDVFVEMDTDLQQALIEAFTDRELYEIVDDLFLDDTVDIIEEMPANVVKRIISHADTEKRKLINQLLHYPEDSAGTIMTTEFVELKANFTTVDAFKSIRRTGLEKETVYTCYVTDDKRILIGVVTVKEMILADEDAEIGEIMDDKPVFVNTDDDKEDVMKAMTKYDFLAMPVVDKEGRLVGIVTIDDAMDVLQEEDTEDIEKMAAITPSDKPYLRTGVFETTFKRIPWLLLLMVSATFTGQIITSFESALAGSMALTAFIPMLMDTGGNAGSQASVTIIRGLALDEIRMGDIFRVMWKEMRVSVLCGAVLAVANFGKIMLVDNLIFHNGVTVAVALVVCVTLVVTVFCSKLVGCTLPIIAKRLGFDPAVMASPFITTIVDAISLIVFFEVAQLLLASV